MSARTQLFQLILEAEHEQELAEWAAIGSQLDRGMAAALAARKSFPKSERDRATVLEAFRVALGQPVAEAEGQSPAGGTGARRR